MGRQRYAEWERVVLTLYGKLLQRLTCPVVVGGGGGSLVSGWNTTNNTKPPHICTLTIFPCSDE